MARIAPLVLLLFVAAGVAVVLATSSVLPPTVASHFAAGGRAGGSMSRGGYQLLFAALMVGMPLVVYATTSWLPSRHPRLVNLPNRDYWLAGTRRESSLHALRLFGLALAISIVALFVALHFLILDAHAQTPPALDEGAFFVLIGAFVSAVLLLVALLYVRFRAPG